MVGPLDPDFLDHRETILALFERSRVAIYDSTGWKSGSAPPKQAPLYLADRFQLQPLQPDSEIGKKTGART